MARHAARLRLQITFPGPGHIVIYDSALFADPRGATAHAFFERAFLAPEVHEVEIDAASRTAQIRFRIGQSSNRAVVTRISRFVAQGGPPAATISWLVVPENFSESEGSLVRLTRFGNRLSFWSVRHELEGRIRLAHPALFRKRDLCQAIERELTNTFGVDRYATNELTASILVHYDPHQIRKHQVVELLDEVLAKSKQAEPSPIDLDLPICAASVGLAGLARFVAPGLTPLASGVFLYSCIPSFKNAYEVLFKEKRLGVDLLDAIVVLVCLGTGQILAGSVLGMSLGVARKLVQKTEDNSKKMLLNVFGKQPRFVWLNVDGQEIETPLEKLRVNDIINVHTGETVPVDGEVVDGMAMIDQHTLTGESAPAEKAKGDKVLAATTVIAGKISVAVTSAGEQTTSAKLARILNDTAGHKLSAQTEGERLADKAVAPTLALGALGLSTIGVNGAVAIVNCDLGTGIRMAAPIAMLSSLTLTAQHGILVKDGRALEAIRSVDTFLFDKTGTLTHERPEVGRILTFGGYSETQMLRWAAAAENKFSHPIAKAILDKFNTLGLTAPKIDESQYHVGYGITVRIEGHVVRVGSARFLEHEGIALPPDFARETAAIHDEGNSLILVGVDDTLGGALELRAADRPEVARVIAGLRARGAKHLAIISGDHDRPTRRLAERLGMDRYFAEVLPQEKARYVEILQKEGRKVCFVGDGINDSIALKKADVSISLRGASSVATDTAQIVFMEESLLKILHLHDISRDLQRNVRRSWAMILGANLTCIAGAFFGGFGVMHSMVFNQIGGLLALGNGLLPLRKVAALRAEQAKLLDRRAQKRASS